MGFWKKLFKPFIWIGKGFKKLFGSEAAGAFARGALALLASEAGQIALRVVTAVETLRPGTDSDLRAEAFRQIRAEAVQSGLDIKDSVINMLIELAVQRLKGSFGDSE